MPHPPVYIFAVCFKKFVKVTEKKMMEKEDTETEEDADDAE